MFFSWDWHSETDASTKKLFLWFQLEAEVWYHHLQAVKKSSFLSACPILQPCTSPSQRLLPAEMMQRRGAVNTRDSAQGRDFTPSPSQEAAEHLFAAGRKAGEEGKSRWKNPKQALEPLELCWGCSLPLHQIIVLHSGSPVNTCLWFMQKKSIFWLQTRDVSSHPGSAFSLPGGGELCKTNPLVAKDVLWNSVLEAEPKFSHCLEISLPVFAACPLTPLTPCTSIWWRWRR